MLNRLIIRNYAIIETLDIEFKQGLTIITGETGAGKSILLGALSLALGKRGDAKIITDGADKCLVEAHFLLDDDVLKKRFEEEELDFDRHLICRREINAAGKSRSFINDTPVSLKTLQEITSNVIELHHQHDNLVLQTKGYQLKLLDALSESTSASQQYHSTYLEWQSAKRDLIAAQEADIAASRKKEFLEFQLQELKQAKLTAGEVATLEETQNHLEHAESIEQVLRQLYNTLQVGNHSLLSQVNSLLRQVDSITQYFSPLQPIAQRLQAMRIELDDLSLEASRLDGPGNNDAAKLSQTQQRLSQLYSLIKKYQCKDEAGLIALFKQIQSELNSMLTANESIEALNLKIASLHSSLQTLGASLTEKRKKGAKRMTPTATKLIHELGMPNATFEVSFTTLPEIGPTGIDEVQFLFSANKGSSIQPLQSVASGGELSRLSLALKSIHASKAELPTIIFDEIDTGISGEVAWRMGQLIRGLAKQHQILMITHSPQIAAHADQQYHVSKVTSGVRDVSAITLLTDKQRVQELAKMLSGDPPSKAAISNAESLLETVR